MSVFSVNVSTDGSYVKGTGYWYSFSRVPWNTPRQWIYDFDGIAFLSYITEDEYNLIVSEFQSYPDYAARSTIWGIDFFGPVPRISKTTLIKEAVNLPIYYVSPQNTRVHKLMYLTRAQIDLIKARDIYGAGLATKNYYGPFGIPYYDDSDSDSTTTSESTSQTSPAGGSSTVSFGDSQMCAASTFTNGGGYVTDSSGNFVTDCFGNPISYGGGPISFSYSDGGYNTGGSTYPQLFGPNSGVYSGSLSAQGNMVAMQLNTGSLNFIDIAGRPTVQPYHSGYFREYWRNPTTTTFGANTQMPALTGVMPDRYPNMTGSAVYYVDLQLSRLSGSNTWNNQAFMNVVNQAISYVLVSNNYLAALKKAETTDLAYYGADNFQILTTQGFSKYQQGQALVKAFTNIGSMASTITSGAFGTANAVAQVLLDLNLGYINNLSLNLYRAGVNFDDLYNSLYTDFITEQLRQITGTADLQTIQEVVGSAIPGIANPLDYTRIDRAAGIPNDSAFASFADVGKDFMSRAPNLVLSTGAEIADLINKIQSNVSVQVEELAGANTLINTDLINSLRVFLPVTANNTPISVLNVVGMASGYLLKEMQKVNEGIAQLYATDYGPQIRSIFNDISRYHARLPLSEGEARETAQWWTDRLESKKSEYYTLIQTIVADTSGNIPAIVDQININYDNFTSNLYYEYQNYNKANIAVNSFGDISSILGFVASMPAFSADPNNIGTDYLLYGLTQNSLAGEVARTVLDQGKNDYFLSNAGVNLTGII